jgi:hypothetical protein
MELGRSGRAMMMMMTSASPVRGGGAGGVAGSLSEVQRARGSSTAIAKFCSTDGRALDHARAGRGSERSAEFGSVHHIRCPLARARARLRSPAAPSPFLFSGLLLAEFRFGASRATRSRRLGRAAAADRRRRFLFRDFRFGATMELGRSGRAMMMMMTSASPVRGGGAGGVAGSLSEVQRARGSSTAIAKFCSTDGRALDHARAGRGSERSAEFGSVHHIRCPLARANNRETRRLANQPPLLKFFYKESDSNERLRVSNWIVQRLYHYAVKETVEL